jgi:hypothetical protein
MDKMSAGDIGTTIAVAAAPMMVMRSLNKTTRNVLMPLVKKENDDMYTKNDVDHSDMISAAAVRNSVCSVVTGLAAAAIPFVPALIPVLLAGATVATVANLMDDSVK